MKTLAELQRREAEIVERIAGMQNGGQLFLLHPFRLLADVGVVLAPELVQEIVKREPNLTALSDHAYEVLKSAPPQKTRFHVRGLFRGDREERPS